MSTSTQPRSTAPAVERDEPEGAVRDILNGGLRILGLVCWALLETSILWPLVPRGAQVGWSRTLGSALLAAHLLLVLTGLWFRWWNRAAMWAVGVLGLATYLVLLPSRGTIDPINYWAPATGASPGWSGRSSSCPGGATSPSRGVATAR